LTMTPHPPPCGYCAMIDRIAFWGLQWPIRRWKRPVLLIVSLVMTIGSLALIVFAFTMPIPSGDSPWGAILAVPFVPLGILGLVVSLRGCDVCVAKLFGSW
jgi:hypothetical protein